MSYGFNTVDDISRAICHSSGMKDKHGTPMCDVNAKIIYDYIKTLEKKMMPKGWIMEEREGSLKVARDLMKVSEEKCNLVKENEKLKEEIKRLRDPDAGKNRLQMALDEIKKLQTQVGVLQRMNKRLRKKVTDQGEEIKAATEVSVVYMKRYEQKAKEERQIDEICSRIKVAPENNIDHLIGKIPS